MLYQPNYCCNCGEGIDRIDWKLWTSRRFCENCETEFRKVEWLPRFGVLGAIILGLFGFGSYLKNPEKPLNLTNNQSVISSVSKTPMTKPEPNSNAPKVQIQTNSAPLNASNPPNQPKSVASNPQISVPKESPQNIPAEAVYFCGAQTKKGTPCTRKVKGAVRCWQHAGQPAIVPKEKLVTGH